MYNFTSTFSTAMLPISAHCLTTWAIIYGIIKMELNFRVATGRITVRSDHIGPERAVKKLL